MKKAIVMAFLLALGWAFTSQAVVIDWATDGVPDGASSAILVYVSDGSTPSYTGGSIANGTELGSAVSGLAITPDGVGEQSTTDSTTRNSGAYFVVLFKTVDDVTYYSYSTTSLVYSDTSAITSDAMTPASGVFSPSSFSTWTTVPEPGSVVLLCLGGAALALRRKQRV